MEKPSCYGHYGETHHQDCRHCEYEKECSQKDRSDSY